MEKAIGSLSFANFKSKSVFAFAGRLRKVYEYYVTMIHVHIVFDKGNREDTRPCVDREGYIKIKKWTC